MTTGILKDLFVSLSNGFQEERRKISWGQKSTNYIHTTFRDWCMPLEIVKSSMTSNYNLQISFSSRYVPPSRAWVRDKIGLNTFYRSISHLYVSFHGVEIINKKASHNLTDAKCRWCSNRLDGAESFWKLLGQTQVMQICQRETTHEICCLAAQLKLE